MNQHKFEINSWFIIPIPCSSIFLSIFNVWNVYFLSQIKLHLIRPCNLHLPRKLLKMQQLSYCSDSKALTLIYSLNPFVKHFSIHRMNHVLISKQERKTGADLQNMPWLNYRFQLCLLICISMMSDPADFIKVVLLTGIIKSPMRTLIRACINKHNCSETYCKMISVWLPCSFLCCLSSSFLTNITCILIMKVSVA